VEAISGAVSPEFRFWCDPSSTGEGCTAQKETELKGRLRQLLGEPRMAELELEMQTQPPVENPFNIQAFK
jgi:hypothetical protein